MNSLNNIGLNCAGGIALPGIGQGNPLTDNCNKEYYSMLGYDGYYTNRNTKKGGGTALYVRSDMSHTSCLKGTYSIDNCFEVTTV